MENSKNNNEDNVFTQHIETKQLTERVAELEEQLELEFQKRRELEKKINETHSQMIDQIALTSKNVASLTRIVELITTKLEGK